MVRQSGLFFLPRVWTKSYPTRSTRETSLSYTRRQDRLGSASTGSGKSTRLLRRNGRASTRNINWRGLGRRRAARVGLLDRNRARPTTKDGTARNVMLGWRQADRADPRIATTKLDDWNFPEKDRLRDDHAAGRDEGRRHLGFSNKQRGRSGRWDRAALSADDSTVTAFGRGRRRSCAPLQLLLDQRSCCCWKKTPNPFDAEWCPWLGRAFWRKYPARFLIFVTP